jgi:two-component system, chemotaxis family, chemotaxis protein CheY
MHILIVDDSRAMRSIVIRAVRAAGFDQASFREAANGAEALAAVRDWKPDLVVSDWNMPEMSGIDLLRKLRQEGNGVHLGFVTSESSPAQRDVAVAAGALFLISKPFTPDAVKAALGAMVA